MKTIFKETSIKKYLGFSLMALVTLPIIIIGIIGITISSSALEKQIINFDHTHMHHIEGLVKQQLKSPLSDLLIISNAISGSEEDDLDSIQKVISAIQVQQKHLFRVQVSDSRGRVVAVAPFEKNIIGLDVSGHDYFVKSLRSNEVFWGASFLPEGANIPLASITKRQDNYIVTVFLSLKELPVFKSLASRNYLEGSLVSTRRLTITDQEGTFIYHPDAKKILTRSYDVNYVPDLKSYNGKISVKNKIIDGVEYIVNIAFIPETNWKIALYTPLSELRIPITKLMFLIIVITIIVSIIALIISIHISNRFNDALNKLIIISDAIGKGEYEIAPDEKNPSQTKFLEFNQLASSFRYMSTKVKDREYKITQVQSYLSNIMDSMPSIIISVDPNLLVTQWNNAAEAASKVTLQEVYGKRLVDVFPQIKSDIYLIKESIENRKAGYLRKKFLIESKNLKYQDIFIYPLIVGDLHGAVIRIDNVTEKVLMEEMMVQNEKMLSIGGLAAGMAHEINNPLAGMMQTANVMSNRLVDKLDLPANKRAAEEAGTTTEAIYKYMQSRDIPRMLHTIKKSGKHAAEVVSNMLNFARKTDHSKSIVSVQDLIEKTLELAVTDYDMKKEYDFKQIKIEKELNSSAPSLLCEQTKIQQVLLNLLRNSAQAMQEACIKDPVIYIRLKTSDDGEFIIIEIEDNGPGMDEEISKRIFEPFFTTKGVGKGTGLGLSVSYFIIKENHGGEISVTSEKGIGTKFIVSLPVKGIKDGQ